MANRLTIYFVCWMAFLCQSHLVLASTTPQFMLGTTDFTPTYLVAAHAPILASTLLEAGWQKLPLVCSADIPFAWPMLAKQSPDSWYMHPQLGFIVIGSHQSTMHGLPVWVVLAYDPGSHESHRELLSCGESLENFYLEVLAQHLLAGIAMLHEAKIASEWGMLPWIEIRESAGALDFLISQSHQDEILCPAPTSSDLLLPPIKPLPLPWTRDVIWRNNQHDNKRVALTFDACSTFSHGDYNHEVIDKLLQYRVPATLFIGGHWAQLHPSTLRTLAQSKQFEFGNHTYSHPHMTRLTQSAQRQELLWTQYLIYAITGVVPQYFRPPYGEVNDNLVKEAAALGLFTIEFDLPAGDADMHVNDRILTNWVVNKVQPGSIVVMHMNRPGNQTAVVLPAIIEALRAKGFTLTTVGDLLGYTEQPMVSP